MSSPPRFRQLSVAATRLQLALLGFVAACGESAASKDREDGAGSGIEENPVDSASGESDGTASSNTNDESSDAPSPESGDTAGGDGPPASEGESGGMVPLSGAGDTPATGDPETPEGECARGSGAAFEPVSDFAARNGGFGPALVERNTGDDALGADRVAVFRPAAEAYGRGGVTHPIIVWGNGFTNTVGIWQGFLARVATYGFVVVAPEQTRVTAAHMNAAVDYVLRLATDSASGDCGKIDTTQIGATGYSLGGFGAIGIASDERISSTFILASNGNVSQLKGPWGVVGGDMDTNFDWDAISGTVSGSAQPAFGAVLAGIDHNRVAGQPKAQEALIGWMRWRLMADPRGRDLFAGESCKICSDTAFSDVLKTVTLESL